MTAVKISKLEIENVKRVKAVALKLEPTGLTILGGDNNQGKTSVLDSIAWALGGNKFKPSNPQREGSVVPPYLHIVLNNGLVVERKGKNSDLKVTDPDNNKAGQQLLDSFVEELALNLSKFINVTNKEKAQILLQIIGVGDQLLELETQEQEKYNERYAVGQIADKKAKFADEQTFYPEAPRELVSASELIKQQQAILAKNGENQAYRSKLYDLEREQEADKDKYKQLEEKIEDLQIQKVNLGAFIDSRAEKINAAKKTVEQLKDESTAELEKNIQDIEEINRKVRANLDKEKAEDDAKEYKSQYARLSEEIRDIRQKKTDLLQNADLPLKELSIENGELIYKNQKWDCMSGSDQLKVATAIVRKLKPNCGFVLIDKLEQMDKTTLKEFGEWLEIEGLQAIATRVSKGEECSLIIEDGYIKQEHNQDEPKKDEWTF